MTDGEKNKNQSTYSFYYHSEFYAPLVQNCSLPEYPILPKYMNLPLPQENNYKYFLSSIELNQEPQIYTDFLLNQKVNLVDPSVYTVPTSPPQIEK